jgi:predicted TIM-barrel fold metal-dependent hydrolase
MIAAHMGMPEYDEFLGFAERFANVRLDTTMCFTDFSGGPEVGRGLAPRLLALQDKVLLGTDYPNIPHPFAHQLEALARLDLGDDWLRAVCWDNAATLFDIVP